MSGRGLLWARILAGVLAFGAILAPFAAPKPYPDLSAATPYGAWAATLASSLFVTLALACAIPMRLAGSPTAGAGLPLSMDGAAGTPDQGLTEATDPPMGS